MFIENSDQSEAKLNIDRAKKEERYLGRLDQRVERRDEDKVTFP